jgi:hypothetical protein
VGAVGKATPGTTGWLSVAELAGPVLAGSVPTRGVLAGVLPAELAGAVGAGAAVAASYRYRLYSFMIVMRLDPYSGSVA